MGLSTVKSMMSFSHATAFDDEVADRKRLVSHLLYTGNAQIDRVFDGIWPNDLVLIGATSGSGKTEILSQILEDVASQGKYVDMFALEASMFEIHRRIKFRVHANLIFRETGEKINFPGWMRFRYEDKIKLIENEANEHLRRLAKYIRIHYRRGAFGVDDFKKIYHANAHTSSLMLCDHAQFFDFDEKKTENAFIKDMTLEMFDLVNNVQVPIILVSHLRKLENTTTMPTEYDFHGSSDLVKKATRVLIIKRYKYLRDLESWETVFNFVKNREFGPRALLALFDTNLRRYMPQYKDGEVSGDKFFEYQAK